MNLVYSITSSGCDVYSRMLRLSIASVRVSNPGARIILVADSMSVAQMRAQADPVLAEADAVMSVTTPDGSADFRSRFVKTSLRSTVAGPFLYLDVDTLVRDSVEPIFRCNADVAGAVNHSKDIFREQRWDGDDQILREMQWAIGETHYLNSGVLYFSDTEAAHSLGRLWHQRWSESANRLGRRFDQPALNHALHTSQPRLAILPHRYNAQIMVSPSTAMDAAIWHYYSINGGDPITAYGIVLNQLEQGSTFDPSLVRPLVQCRHPWRREMRLDDLAAWSVKDKPKLDDEDLLWFRGERWASIRLRLRRAFRRSVLVMPGGARLLDARRKRSARAESKIGT